MPQKRWTIRRRSIGESAGYRHGEKVTNFWEKNSKNTILYITLIILALCGISVAIYFMAIKLQEGFGCSSCSIASKLEEKNKIDV